MSDRFSTPYVPTRQYQRGSLGELIARRGDIEAQGALQSGGAWANAISQIGQIAGGALQDYSAQKEQKATLKAKELAERPAREMAATKNRLEMEKLQREGAAAGKADVDQSSLMKAMSGTRTQAFEMLKDRPDLQEKATAHFDNKDKRMSGYLGQSAAAIRGFGDDPRAAMMELQDLEDNGMDPAKLKPYRDAIASDPKSVSAIVDSLLLASSDKDHHALATKKLTPQEIAMGEDRKADNARAERLLAETIRHNKTVEGQAATKARTESGGSAVPIDGAVAFVGQPGYQKLTTKQKSQAVALDGLVSQLDIYKKLLDDTTDSTGINVVGKDAGRLRSMASKLKFTIAQAEETGALQKADAEIIGQMLGDPTDLTSAVGNWARGGKSSMIENVDELIRGYEGKLGTLGLRRDVPNIKDRNAGKNVDLSSLDKPSKPNPFRKK